METLVGRINYRGISEFLNEKELMDVTGGSGPNHCNGWGDPCESMVCVNEWGKHGMCNGGMWEDCRCVVP